MQSQSNSTVKLLASDMQKAQRLIEAMRDQIGAIDLVVLVCPGQWLLDWTGPNGEDFLAGGSNLNEAFADALLVASDDK